MKDNNEGFACGSARGRATAVLDWPGRAGWRASSGIKIVPDSLKLTNTFVRSIRLVGRKALRGKGYGAKQHQDGERLLLFVLTQK
jgi:hypothetical protein